MHYPHTFHFILTAHTNPIGKSIAERKKNGYCATHKQFKNKKLFSNLSRNNFGYTLSIQCRSIYR